MMRTLMTFSSRSLLHAVWMTEEIEESWRSALCILIISCYTGVSCLKARRNEINSRNERREQALIIGGLDRQRRRAVHGPPPSVEVDPEEVR